MTFHNVIVYFFIFQFRTLQRYFSKLNNQTGATGDMDPLEREILMVMGANKHLHPKALASSNSGIKRRSNYLPIFNVFLLINEIFGYNNMNDIN